MELSEKAKKLGNECVIPRFFQNEDGNIRSASCISKREYFAAMAMNALNSNIYANHMNRQEIAESSVKHADALLEELVKE